MHDAILAAARLAEVDVVYRVGGAQAIAALAYGTETDAAVDVIVGPGSAYVAEAKRQVAVDVAIDGYAGPSEIAIVADEAASPTDVGRGRPVGPGRARTRRRGRAHHVVDEEVAERGRARRSARLLAGAPRARRDRGDAAMPAAASCSSTAPSRRWTSRTRSRPSTSSCMCADAERLVPLVRNAGAVFVGGDASAVIGDYVAGVNHVLPTGGTARFGERAAGRRLPQAHPRGVAPMPPR